MSHCYTFCSANRVDGCCQGCPDEEAHGTANRPTPNGHLATPQFSPERLMNVPTTKSSLSDSEAHLLELLQQLNFGRIECLKVADGRPVLVPPPRIIQKFKMGGENSSRPEVSLSDFRLKQDVIELFSLMRRMHMGEIHCIEVRHGLPISVEVTWGNAEDDDLSRSGGVE
jgi:hypothetical protein